MNADTIRFLKAAYKEHYFHDSERIEFPKSSLNSSSQLEKVTMLPFTVQMDTVRSELVRVSVLLASCGNAL